MTCLLNCSRSPTPRPDGRPVHDRIVGTAAPLPTTADLPAAMASANAAIVMSVLIGMGVLFTSTLRGKTDESPGVLDDPANPRRAQAGRRPDYGANINSDAWKSGAMRLDEFAASG